MSLKKETFFTHMGRPKAGLGTPVNPDVTHASTLLFEQAEDLYRTDIRGYGRGGSAVHDHLMDAFTALEGGVDTTLTPSGLAACTLAILACVKSGDHILITDSIYGPTRSFALNYLKNMNVEAEFYDPHIGSDINSLVRENTSAIMMESPGSLTFEIQDIPAITKVARAHNVTTIIDNTWSAGLSLQPLSLGVDISVHSATKYFCGHGDILFGAVVSGAEHHAKRVAGTARSLGYATSPDDAYQILRGFRSVKHRFDYQAASALELATWLANQPQVSQILHPALPSHPDHTIWKRDFTGGSNLFAFTLKPCSQEEVYAFVNALELFGIGYSYGGYESLVIHCDPQLKRNHGKDLQGPLIRFSCGLEDTDDLKNDVKQALRTLD